MILVDTGAIYAILDKGDTNHVKARQTFRTVAGKEELVVISPVLVESILLLDARLGSHIARRFIEAIVKGIFSYHDVHLEEISRAVEIDKKYKSAKFGLIDALCFAFAEKQNIRDIFTFDKHFRIYKPAHISSFNILP
jgi:predicted nucleic acid-binding protein